MSVDDVVQERIAAARIRIAAARRRREELSAARARGLRARHAAKLRNLAAREGGAQPPAIPLPKGSRGASARGSDHFTGIRKVINGGDAA